MADKITIENVNHPGSTQRVDAKMYEAMKKAYLEATPASPPGLRIAEIEASLRPNLPQDLYPGGAKAGWWAKAVQLDLEAKGIIRRMQGSPVRLHKV